MIERGKMTNKFIIFDRDGVINIEKNYLYKIEDFEYENGVVESLKELEKRQDLKWCQS